MRVIPLGVVPVAGGYLATFVVERRRKRRVAERAAPDQVRPEELAAAERDADNPIAAEALPA